MEEEPMEKAESESESESERSAASEEMWERLEQARRAVRRLPGADLWKPIEVLKAFRRKNDKDDDTDQVIQTKIDYLRNFLSIRLSWLDMMRNEPLVENMDRFELNRLWRLKLTIALYSTLEILALEPLEMDREITNDGMIPEIWSYMKIRWAHDKDITLDEFTRFFHLFFQTEHNGRKRDLAIAEEKRRRNCQSPPLRVKVLKKLASRHGGSGIHPKKKDKMKHKRSPPSHVRDKEDVGPIPSRRGLKRLAPPHMSKLRPTS